MNTEHVDERIKTLNAERKVLEETHATLVQENQKRNQEFQQQVLQNQTRFAQIQGALAELQQLKKNTGDNNEPESEPVARHQRSRSEVKLSD